MLIDNRFASTSSIVFQRSGITFIFHHGLLCHIVLGVQWSLDVIILLLFVSYILCDFNIRLVRHPLLTGTYESDHLKTSSKYKWIKATCDSCLDKIPF